MSEVSTRHPTPAHVSLAVVLQVRSGLLQVLLWRRARAPFKGKWSLPGGYLVPGETLEASIRRHLADKVDVGALAPPEPREKRRATRRAPPEWPLSTA
jgi:ADP-ribose pyrophosphatase YjhB (NUDIX family)